MKLNIYHKRFIDSFSAENVIGLFSRYKNSYKEITESWAMLEAAQKFAKDIIDECKVIVVGDGRSPRTGAIFAYYTKADVISVDPNINLKHWAEHYSKQWKMGFKPQRITVRKINIEDIEIDCKEKPCIVLWPHSHANMNKTNIINYSKRYDIAMPCCIPIPANWMSKPHIVYSDFNILSPKRDMHIWETQNEET